MRRKRLEEQIFMANSKTMHDYEGYDIYYGWPYANLESVEEIFYPEVVGSTRETRPLIEDTHVNWADQFYYSINHDDLIPGPNGLLPPFNMGPIAPEQPAGQVDEEDMDSSGEAASTSSVQPGSQTSIHHSSHTAAAPVPSAYLGLSMAELVVPPTAMTPTTAGTTIAASDPLPADLQLIDWNALFAEHQALLNANNPAVGMNAIHGGEGAVGIEQVIAQPPANQEELVEIVAGLDAAQGVNAGDLNEIIADPPVNQEGFNEIMGDLNALPAVNAGDLDALLAPADQNAENEMMAETEPIGSTRRESR